MFKNVRDAGAASVRVLIILGLLVLGGLGLWLWQGGRSTGGLTDPSGEAGSSGAQRVPRARDEARAAADRAPASGEATDSPHSLYRQARFTEAMVAAEKMGGELAGQIERFAILYRRILDQETPAADLPSLVSAARGLDAQISPSTPHHRRIQREIERRGRRRYLKAYLIREEDPAKAQQMLADVIALLPESDETGRKARELQFSLVRKAE